MLPPFDRDGPCRKCGTEQRQVALTREPDRLLINFAFIPRWLRLGQKAAMRRHCLACNAVYHEAPLDASAGPGSGNLSLVVSQLSRRHSEPEPPF